MKKNFIVLFLLLFSQIIYAHSIGFEAGMPYYDDNFSIQDLFINGKIDITKNSEIRYDFNWFKFNNFRISDFYTLDKFNFQIHTLAYKYNFSNPYVKSVGADINFFKSASEKGKIHTTLISLDANPDIGKTFGGGLYAEFFWNIGLFGQFIYSEPVIHFEKDQIKGSGYLTVLDLSKEFKLNKSNLQLHVGSLYGTGKCEDNYTLEISWLEQNYDIIAEANLFSIFGLANYDVNINDFSLKLLSGIAYIPVMNYSYECVRHWHLKLGTKWKWYKKVMADVEADPFQNYLLIPFVFNSSYSIRIKKCSIIPELEKAFVIPVDLDGNEHKNTYSGNKNSACKTLLLSGLSLKISVSF